MKRRAPRTTRSKAGRNPRGARRAFTLLEVSLVLAVLLILGAIIWPWLDGVFADRRLRAVADQLRADFTRARVAAMESGRAHALLYDSAAGRYAVFPLDDLSDSDPFSLPSGPAGPPLPVFENDLAEGVHIASLQAIDDATPAPSAGGMPLVPVAAAGPGATGAAAATPSASLVYFHPDGTTSSVVATLAGEYDLAIEVRLRGFTGATAMGEVFVVDGISLAGDALGPAGGSGGSGGGPGPYGGGAP